MKEQAAFEQDRQAGIERKQAINAPFSVGLEPGPFEHWHAEESS